MPAELKPNWKRKAQAKNSSSKVRKVVDIEERLKELEQKEKNRKDDDEPQVKDGDKESENVVFLRQYCSDDDSIDNSTTLFVDFQDEGEENLDDELDDENDYLASYFENGDAYLDEDDNLDDGPTY